MYYLEILTLHIIFAGAWLFSFVADSLIKTQIHINRNKSGERKFIHFYLTYVNLIGMIASTGILVTGIFMVLVNDGYGFFQMTGNHWLTTKQILMVVLLIMISAFVIPTAKKIRAEIGPELESTFPISEDGYKSLNKLFMLNRIINIIVFINFLLAITHRLIT